MLGRFLELALLADDPGAGWHALQRLGFVDAPGGDIRPYPYGVMACEGLAIGLHARGEEPRSLVFVRPDVAALERELTARFIEVETTRLGSDVFNELALREPGGMLLRVVEARTFSPPADLPARVLPGRFRGISLPCDDLAEARGFWERLDRDVEDAPAPWRGIAIAGWPIACHDRQDFREATLLFDGAEADDHALRSAGLSLLRPLPWLRAHPHRVARTIEGLAMVLLGATIG